MIYSMGLWGTGMLVIIIIFYIIGKSYYFSDKKDKISKHFSTFYSPSIFTLVVSLRTLSISNFSKSDKPLEFLLEHLYFLFAISIMLNLLNVVIIEFDSLNKIKKEILFYITLFFNGLSFVLWIVITYLLFEIL
ncbi:hypothetical protein [Vagococcus fluvialis]|uniref:Uncharacterized protein n=1 Tax=Vagococcus fluvialis TaxID=2738 RepID=A0A7X6I3J0_9ENTE|nr:hypothetical protein [Vagococcus fluvialis]NKC68526.1 hypothetical protein [Vagococcus fluvialis]